MITMREFFSFSDTGQPRIPKGGKGGGRWRKTETLMRVEHKTSGAGPYHNVGGGWEEMEGGKPSLKGKPSPQGEGFNPRKRFQREKQIVRPHYAFRNEQQLRSYFTEGELERLGKLGYEVVRVEGEIVWESASQVAYLPKGGRSKYEILNDAELERLFAQIRAGGKL